MTDFLNAIYYQPLWIHVIICVMGVLVWGQLGYIAIIKKKIWNCSNIVLFVITSVIIVWQTFLFRTETERIIEFIPLINLINSTSNEGILRSMTMNVLLFIPFGMSVPFILPKTCRKRIMSTILYACILSLIIESVQYIFALGRAEVDDIICNTLGAAIGCLSYWLRDIIEKRKMRKRHE